MGIMRDHDAGWTRLRVLYVRARRYYFVWFMSDSEIILYTYLNNLRIILYFICKFNYLFCHISYTLHIRGYIPDMISLMPTRENVRWWPFTTLLIFTLFDYLRGIKLNKSIKPNRTPLRHGGLNVITLLNSSWYCYTHPCERQLLLPTSQHLWINVRPAYELVIAYRTHSFSHQKPTMST